ncbi:MAG TPA: phage major capsid protein [Phycisphaerae bacterium]|nr:phage major capsid protein [Phycisphaerae bacterium]
MAPDIKQELQDELVKLTNTLRTEYDAKLAGHVQVADFSEFQTKIMARQQEIIDTLAELKKPAIKIERGDIASPVNPEHTKAFYQWFRGKDFERKALISNAAGQIILPEELEATIRMGLPQLNVIRPLCSVMTTSRERIRARSMSVPTVAWGKLELGAALATSTPVPTEAYWYPEDLNGLVQVGVDEMADTDQNLAAFLATQFTIAMANAEERAFAIGVGHTVQQPAGIFSTVGAIPTHALTAAGAIIFEDIKHLIAALPPQYRTGASFLMHTNTELELQLLRAIHAGPVSAEFLWQPSLIAGNANNLCGYPVYNSDSIAQHGDGTLQKITAFGNWKYAYQIVDREGMSLKQLNELYITSGMVGFLAQRRVTGNVCWPDAARILIEP